MPYPSIDKLQKTLAKSVFSYAKDTKKASGRALRTLVEIVTYYTLCAWGLRDSIAIERRIPEFANHEITHNVEFSLHPIISQSAVKLSPPDLPVTSAKLFRAMGGLDRTYTIKAKSLVDSKGVMRNAAIIAERDGCFITSNVDKLNNRTCDVSLRICVRSPL